MNLSGLLNIVNHWTNDSYEFKCNTFKNPHSYRGDYNDLAFEICDAPLTVREIKQFVKAAATETFIGWKGGNYEYDEYTQIHLSARGQAADAYGYDFHDLIHSMKDQYMKDKTEANQNNQQTEDKFCAEYQTRLLKVVGLYIENIPLQVRYSFGVFTFNTDYGVVRLVYAIPDSHICEEMNDLEKVETWIERYVGKLEEERLLATKREEALAKLTEEERKLLGL